MLARALAAAALALLIAAGEGGAPAVWVYLSVQIAFAGVFFHHRLRMTQMAEVERLGDDDEQDPVE